MRNIVASFKLVLFVLLSTSFFVTTFPFYLYGHINRYGARKYTALISSFHAWLTLYVFNIRANLEEGLQTAEGNTGSLIVSNHLSYIDVMVISIFYPSCFVTSIEMKNTFFLGQLCEAGGCLYVERRSRMNLDREVDDITHALSSGLNVVVFPEATSTNGDEVKRFKRPLFRAAINSGANIVPISMNYKSINNEQVTTFNRDTVFWYGDMTFFSHFWEMLKAKRIDVDVVVGEEIHAKKHTDETDLAQVSHLAVSSRYHGVLSEATL